MGFSARLYCWIKQHNELTNSAAMSSLLTSHFTDIIHRKLIYGKLSVYVVNETELFLNRSVAVRTEKTKMELQYN
jgi:hypothetical protein